MNWSETSGESSLLKTSASHGPPFAFDRVWCVSRKNPLARRLGSEQHAVIGVREGTSEHAEVGVWNSPAASYYVWHTCDCAFGGKLGFGVGRNHVQSFLIRDAPGGRPGKFDQLPYLVRISSAFTFRGIVAFRAVHDGHVRWR